MSEERSLVKQLNVGSKQALRQIYEKYSVDLFTIAVSLVGDRHLAEDCLQDAFVHLAQAAGRIQIRSNLKGYLASAIVNRARDHLRRRAKQIDCPVEELQLEERTLGPDQHLICGEQTSAILQAIAKLPIEQREVFVLHTQGAMSFRRIARQQGISVRTAHSRYRYAINKLRQLLRKEVPF
jgi:RNA polymerase sigma-70 factor (ECF subfamily)